MHIYLASIIGFEKAQPPFIYIGVPIFIDKAKVKHLKFIVDHIKHKLSRWKASLLSMVGRLQFAKFVVQSMTLHSIKIYNWPVNLL